jgi:hypothetical protein
MLSHNLRTPGWEWLAIISDPLRRNAWLQSQISCIAMLGYYIRTLAWEWLAIITDLLHGNDWLSSQISCIECMPTISDLLYGNSWLLSYIPCIGMLDYHLRTLAQEWLAIISELVHSNHCNKIQVNREKNHVNFFLFRENRIMLERNSIIAFNNNRFGIVFYLNSVPHLITFWISSPYAILVHHENRSSIKPVETRKELFLRYYE